MDKYFSKDLCIDEDHFMERVEMFGRRNALDKPTWAYLGYLYYELKGLEDNVPEGPGMEECFKKIEELEKALKDLTSKCQKEVYRVNWLNENMKKVLDILENKMPKEPTPEKK